MTRALMIAVLLLTAAGCGDDEDKAPTLPRKPRDAGTFEPVDSGPQEATGPVIVFSTPMAASDPKKDTVVTDLSVTVRCKVTKRMGESAVDKSSIKISMDKKVGTTDMMVTSAVNTLPNDEFEAKFDVGAMPNGVLKFHCEAKDLATKPRTAKKTLETLLDLGPTIEVREPSKKAYALTRPVAFEMLVTASPLADGDDEADVDSVKLEVAGTDIELAESSETVGLYQASVNFSDKSLFKVVPTSVELLMSATNKRSPQAATRTVKSDIRIDGEGPIVKFESPKNTALVHGEVLMSVIITDDIGVNPDSVKARIDGEDVLKPKDWKRTDNKFEGTFDTRRYPSSKTELTITLVAEDTAGNATQSDLTLRLDNVPPLLSLNPPRIREWRKGDAGKVLCSRAFDPVGDDATDDLEQVDQSSLYRVLIEDRTNYSPGANATYYAGVDQTKVELWAQPDPSIPLLIDTNGDGICDEINKPDDHPPTPKQLKPVVLSGSSYFSPTGSFEEQGVHEVSKGPQSYLACMTDSSVTMAPDPLCNSQMLRVVRGRSSEKPFAIYGIEPANATNLPACAGNTWDAQSVVGNGWACIAARAEDTIGNVGISAPLRVCFKYMSGGEPCTANDSVNAPSCLGNCKIDESQKYPENEVWQKFEER